VGESAAAVLLITCPDRRGIVAAVSRFVLDHGGNVLHADQHIDAEAGIFFQRVEFDLAGFDLDRDEITDRFRPIADEFGMTADVRFTDVHARTAILASRQPHCLYDLLARWKARELPTEIALVISNHPDHGEVAGFFGVPFFHLPVTPETKPRQELRMTELLAASGVELVVLARYMQILTPSFVDRYPNRIINIHHSFLPAFVGARPYHQAFARGVKLVGVTAHYVTSDLDEGPIIDQDVVRVNHRDTVDDLVRKGRDLEQLVLARAVRYHLEHRVLVYGNKTVVFA
jgi:formyltetrahydrofolate deformylase